ncbi:MAG: NUMOD4 domain-containing protein [Xanthobacteraceae bacterium]
MQVTDAMVAKALEVWKTIPGWERSYEASTEGNIRSVDRAVTRPDGSVQKFRGKVLRRSINSKGYLIVSLHDGARQKRGSFRVHRLVASTFIPNPMNLPEVNHIDSDRTNARVENLEWVTPSQNRYHGYHCGFVVMPRHFGTENNAAKLTYAKADEIRHLHRAGESQRSLGRRFGVHHKTISDIISGKNWNLPAPPMGRG